MLARGQGAWDLERLGMTVMGGKPLADARGSVPGRRGSVPVARRGGYSFERKINGGPLLT